MKRIGHLLLVCLLFALPIYSQAESIDSRLLKLDHLSEQILEFTKAGRYHQSKELLETFQREQVRAQRKNDQITEQEWAVITEARQQAYELMQSPEGKEQQCIERATAFRLAVNAVSSDYKPLWIRMEKPVMTSLNELKKSSSSADHSRFHESLNAFLAHYDMLQPSLQLDIPAGRLASLENHVRYVDHFRERLLNEGASAEDIERLEKEVDTIFREMHQEEVPQPSLGWVIGITGGIIMTTLSYVGWRKYRGEKEEARHKPNH
ncbi:sporulation protein YpjB [Bacillus xiapuensis]|uniref:sporulation protein YpjB n=1 Tax=Bacillus xiapuensis TaxID=2014075 RepID=UPI000C240354|nr:sporulation protein YpjB [Bacillus xiapuensis]